MSDILEEEKRKRFRSNMIGNVELRANPRARRLKLRVTWNGIVQITLPPGVSKRQAISFAVENAAWIDARRNRLERLAAGHHRLPLGERIFLNMAEASRFLTDRLKCLAVLHGLCYQKVTIRHQRTRWGSCSGNNCISLNIRLASLPSELMDYVLLHELVHTRIHSHGPVFWEALHRLVPDGEILRKRLRNYFIEWVPVPGVAGGSAY